jgi:hypothetical protein
MVTAFGHSKDVFSKEDGSLDNWNGTESNDVAAGKIGPTNFEIVSGHLKHPSEVGLVNPNCVAQACCLVENESSQSSLGVEIWQ